MQVPSLDVPSVSEEALPGRPYPRIQDSVTDATFGGPVAKGFEDLSSVMSAEEGRLKVQHDHLRVIDANTQLEAGYTAMLYGKPAADGSQQGGAFSLRGIDAINLPAKLLPEYQKLAESISSTLTPDQQAMFSSHVAEGQRKLNGDLNRYEYEQSNHLADAIYSNGVNQAIQGAALGWRDPLAIGKSRADIKALVQMQGDREGAPQELRDAQTQKILGQMHFAVLDGMLNAGAVPVAKAYLDSARGELSAADQAKADTAIQAGEVDTTADRIMSAYKADTELGAQAMSALAKSDLTNEQQSKVIQQVERQRNALAVQRQQDPDIRKQLTSLEDSIAAGQPSVNALGQVESLWRTGALSDDGRLSLRGQIDRLNAKNADDAAMLAHYRDAYGQSQPLDPGSGDDRKGVDTLFRHMTATTSAGGSAWTNRAVDVATRTGVVPTSAVQWATANLVSGRPEDAATAADMLARIDEANPRSYGFIDEKTRVMADTVNAATRAGTAPEVAVELARNNANLSKADHEVLTERWKALKAKDSQAGALTNLLKDDSAFKPGLFSSVPTIPTALLGEFDDLSQRYFEMTGGNLGQARELAARDLKRTWGVSEVNGKRELMQYPPETMFPGLSAPVVREDIAKALSDNAEAFQRYSPANGKLETATPKAQDVRLIATDRTARTGGREWTLGAPDEFGAMDVLRGQDGNPLTYRLPVSQTDYATVRERMNEAALAKARQVQAEREAAGQREVARETAHVSPF